MKNLRATLLLAALALLVLPALPVLADAPPDLEPAVEAPGDAVVDAPGEQVWEPAPTETMPPPKCGPKEEKLTTSFLFGLGQNECEQSCTAFCQDNGGYVLTFFFSPRGLSCDCTCCVPR